MKRSGPPTRRKSLRRSAKQIRRQSERARRKAMRTAEEWELEKIAREAWARAVKRYGCVMCKAYPVPDNVRLQHKAALKHREAHHVLAQRHLKREGLSTLLWDSDNGMALCEYHHWRHEKAIQRVPRWILPAASIAFAERLGLGHHIDREYPAS